MCYCFIVPQEVLDRFSKDQQLSDADRQRFADMVGLETHWRQMRALHTTASDQAMKAFSAKAMVAAKPAVTVYDCKHGTTLPGTPVSSPGTATDATAKRAFTETTAVADFYKQIFGRNSVDNLAMTLQSSLHYGVKYNNAFWNGTQMTYGDGDGNIFVDFTLGDDVIGHELTHGVTQFSAQLNYTDEPGGLNESISDVFGSMFRQWRNKQNVAQADWLIGKEIMGPGAKARGYTCLRDMARPDATHCLSPQPKHYSQYRNGMDPHTSSGIPNLAFYNAAMAVGGFSWEKTGQIWYQALTTYGPSQNLKMSTFAGRTREIAKKLYPKDASILLAVDNGWKMVGL